MTQDLKVTAGHVRELGGKQGAIATGIGTAKSVTEGSTWDVGVSHGLICYASTMALLAANVVRDGACDAMQGTSQQLEERLEVAASHYDATDAETGAWLDGTMGR